MKGPCFSAMDVVVATIWMETLGLSVDIADLEDWLFPSCTFKLMHPAEEVSILLWTLYTLCSTVRDPPR
jgi:hypothetical protein